MHKYDDGGGGGDACFPGLLAGVMSAMRLECTEYKYPTLKSSSNVPWRQSYRAHNQPTQPLSKSIQGVIEQRGTHVLVVS